MSTKKMLIDATHPEETRVVVLNGERLEDYDVEVASRKQLKGNIYLAKVTRVEPSLQAAFVDFGGNRHGFLAFNEIHPDYYQIPVEDREALLAEQGASADDDEEPEESDADNGEEKPAGTVESVGGDDSDEVEARRPRPSHRNYKIQEVIKRRQILLVQVVKEERGNKGAALTTYVSLAGRYCVLMPNTARGGGISRKIAAGNDRKRLKSILKDLSLPDGIAVIVRTAGSDRSKAEIKRDYEYLMRLWNQVRELTLESIAPSLVHEEGNLIKRSIRDLYNSEISEVVVDGDEAYRLAKDFMKLLIPSHSKRVQRYKDANMPMFLRFNVESQLDAMHSSTVQLRSGGYIVINPTEALVSIDVNSGRATRERNIEETALKTNQEASDEIARQLRLRDLAGLIVIDYIDMERPRNQSSVERRLKDAMRHDRARIQMGRISPFGLLEMSRQRLRPSLIETSFEICVYCAGSGTRRSTESTALYILRAIEEETIRKSGGTLTVHVPTEVALYVLNNKRAALQDIESRFSCTIQLTADDTLIPPESRIERSQEGQTTTKTVGRVDEAAATLTDASEDGGKRRRRRRPRRRKRGEDDRPLNGDDAVMSEETPSADAADKTGKEERDDDSEQSGKRRRRGKRGGRRRGRNNEEAAVSEETVKADAETADTQEAVPASGDEAKAADGKDEPEKKPSRRKRAPRKASSSRTAKSKKDADSEDGKAAAEDNAESGASDAAAPESAGDDETKADAPAKPKRRTRRKAKSDDKAEDKPVKDETEEKPAKSRKSAKEKPAAAEAETVKAADTPTENGEDLSRTTVINVGNEEAAAAEKQTRKGWWNRA